MLVNPLFVSQANSQNSHLSAPAFAPAFAATGKPATAPTGTPTGLPDTLLSVKTETFFVLSGPRLPESSARAGNPSVAVLSTPVNHSVRLSRPLLSASVNTSTERPSVDSASTFPTAALPVPLRSAAAGFLQRPKFPPNFEMQTRSGLFGNVPHLRPLSLKTCALFRCRSKSLPAVQLTLQAASQFPGTLVDLTTKLA